MFHAVRGYKYYIPLKRRAILTLQIFCCRKINFRGTKINDFFASIFHTMKFDFSATQKICKKLCSLENAHAFSDKIMTSWSNFKLFATFFRDERTKNLKFQSEFNSSVSFIFLDADADFWEFSGVSQRPHSPKMIWKHWENAFFGIFSHAESAIRGSVLHNLFPSFL